MLFRAKRQTAALTEIIGDPHADEYKWMTACAALGEQSNHLSKAELKKMLLPHPLAHSAVILIVTMNCLMNWMVVSLAFINFAEMSILGRQASLVALVPALAPGILLSLFGTIGFWQQFYANAPNKIRTTAWFGLTVVMALIPYIFGNFRFLDGNLPLALVIVPVVAALIFYPMNALAAKTREALPRSFRSEKALFLTALMSVPSLVIFGLDSVFQLGILTWQPTLCLFLVSSIALPAFVMARVGRSTDLLPSLCLNTICNAPLVLGMIALMVVGSAFNFPTTLNADPVFWGLAALLTFLLTLLPIAIGSFLGVKQNQMIVAASLKRLATAPSAN